jgi:hypothetical protein
MAAFRAVLSDRIGLQPSAKGHRRAAHRASRERRNGRKPALLGVFSVPASGVHHPSCHRKAPAFELGR